jgi:rhodanese-related sulfurtransferase
MLTTLIIILALIAVLVTVTMITHKGFSSVNPQAAQEMLKNSGTTLLDVRTPEEFRAGHLKGATLIPVAELAERIGELGSEKERQILVYCRGGNRSLAASRILKQNGFTRIANLQGGIMAWTGAGYPTANGDK